MSAAREPDLSWDAIEPGAAVFAFGGRQVGRVLRVVGDAKADIFTGVVVSVYGAERFIASRRVRGISAAEIEIDATHADIDHVTSGS